jgi:hypothetical protein
MDFIWTNDFIGDIGVWTAGVYSTSFVEKACNMSTTMSSHTCGRGLLTLSRARSCLVLLNSESQFSDQ